MAKNLTFEERYTIECMLNANYSLKSIYSCIKRTYRTLKREISRCDPDKYNATVAQEHASKKMSRKQSYNLDVLAEEYIRNRLIKDKWSPMIISKRIEAAGFDPVSHTYIYSYIHKGSSLVSSVDRKSRFCCLDKVENKTKELVCDTVVDSLNNIGFDHILTHKFDK